MPESAGGTKEGLQRQRRNLIILSALLLFVSISDVQIKSDMNIFGANLTISRQYYFYIAIWIMWWWFLYRYYQYYKQEAADTVKGTFNGYLSNLLLRRLNGILISEQEGKDHNTDGYRTYSGFSRVSLFHICIKLDIKRVNRTNGGLSTIYNEEEIGLEVYWKDLIRTFFHFLLRRTEFTDYLFPIGFAFAGYVYSFFFCDWDGGFWKLIVSFP